MAKKNFKGGLDSLIENSLGIKKSRKGEMKGNPVDLIKPEQTDDNDEVLAKPRTPKQPVVKRTEGTEGKSTEGTEAISTEGTEVKSTENTEVKKETETEPVAQTTVAEPVAQTKAEPVAQTTVAEPVAQTTVAEPVAQTEPEKNEAVEEPLEFENIIEPDDEPIELDEPVEDNRKVMTVSLDAADDDSVTTAYLKEVISDLRHELFLWRNGTINVQTFNATLHTHGLKYNPENNEIEEFDTV
ncbi:MAG: hypothetical protein J6U21_02800 [Bacteroidales bacterium]|nr:hypothetical protein [Bacteroidales bacterium]